MAEIDPLKGLNIDLFPRLSRLTHFIFDQIHTQDDARSDHNRVDEMFMEDHIVDLTDPGRPYHYPSDPIAKENLQRPYGRTSS